MDDDDAGGADMDDVADEPKGDAAPQADTPAVINPEGVDGDYVAPPMAGALFGEDFQSGLGKWTQSRSSSGRFEVGQGAKPTFPGDRGLIIPQKARMYILSAPVEGADDPSDGDFVVQYEVKLEDGMTCGGAYVKLPTDGFPGGEAFDNTAKYSVMFGPDKCGSTSKVHVIFQSRLGEHHLTSPPEVVGTYDKKTHLYTLVVRKDGTVTVAIDGEVKRTANLSEDFEPAFQPPEEIEDKGDVKPESWVDVKKIPDPEAVHPPKEEWDDDAPEEIPDEDAAMPEGWLEDEPLQVRDPDAVRPEEWDEEEDGEWEAPMVPNPNCAAVGCGKWQRPTKANPAHKGVWKAPLIDNPAYIGEWSPRKIPNPDYYKLDKPVLMPVRAVGFELWTMDQGVLFDNLWIGTDVEAAEAYAAATFEKKRDAEKAADKAVKDAADKAAAAEAKSPQAAAKAALGKLESALSALEAGLQPIELWLAKIGAEPVLDKMITAGVAKPLLVVVSVPLMIVLMMIMLLSGGGGRKPAAPTVGDKKKRDVPSADDKPAEGADDDVQAAGSEAAAAPAAEPAVRRRRAVPE
jgi:calnexin